jgi:Rrf2 family protein
VLSLTRKTDYALVALADMARNGHERSSARSLSTRLNVPPRLLTNILSQLTHHGLVISVRGANGGYALAKPPEEISLRELIEAVEGPVRLARCCVPEDNGDPPTCERTEICLNRDAVRKLHESLKGYLDEITLSDIAFNTVPMSVSI